MIWKEFWGKYKVSEGGAVPLFDSYGMPEKCP